MLPALVGCGTSVICVRQALLDVQRGGGHGDVKQGAFTVAVLNPAVPAFLVGPKDDFDPSTRV
jgi:hypothetical protein